MCTSCAKGKPHNPATFEFCENGAKATIWDLTTDRCGPAFFQKHSLTTLRRWSDHDLEKAGRLANLYMRSERVIGVYGMGLTQHVHGPQNVQMLVNLLLPRGKIGRSGAGIFPVRGHSNVQGQRTVGISEKPELVPLDRLAAMFGFEPPRTEGLTTVKVAEGMIDGLVSAFPGLGGNFARAIADVARVDATWANLALTVQIATKLNRSHLMPGRAAWLLPCLSRAEQDDQASGPQTDYDDGLVRRVAGLCVTPYDLPPGCIGAYYPETNALVPLGLRDLAANTPAYKGVPVRMVI